MSQSRQTLGQRGESVAAVFLEQQGFRILERNFRTRFGEIDLIAEQHGHIHIVEVKTARSAHAGDPLDWITPRKQAQLVRMAQAFFAQRGDRELPRIFFSALSVNMAQTPPRITWLPDAFCP